ncbi:MAG: hypothetical protein KJ771_08575 [Nanoarchaeota archaeon]|nr:hypothetical protein [Nanoarchaeota archaeon]
MSNKEEYRENKSIELTEAFLSSSRAGTVLLAIVNLVEMNGYATYDDIFRKAYGKSMTEKVNNAPVHKYINQLEKGIVFRDSRGQFKKSNSFKILKKDKRGIYKYNREELIDLFIWSFYSLNYRYNDKDYCNLLKNVRNQILNYIVHFAKGEVCEATNWKDNDLYSISDIISWIEMDILILRAKKDPSLSPELKKLADKMIEDGPNENPFSDLK